MYTVRKHKEVVTIEDRRQYPPAIIPMTPTVAIRMAEARERMPPWVGDVTIEIADDGTAKTLSNEIQA
jgi:hypothetical protein